MTTWYMPKQMLGSITPVYQIENIYRCCPLLHGGNTPCECLYLQPKKFNIQLWKVRPKITSPPNYSSAFAWDWTCQHVPPALHVSTLLSTWEVRVALVIQMYPQSTGRGSVTAMLRWWGSVRGCSNALVWRPIYCVTFYNVVHQIHFRADEHLKSRSLDVGKELMWKAHSVFMLTLKQGSNIDWWCWRLTNSEKKRIRGFMFLFS